MHIENIEKVNIKSDEDSDVLEYDEKEKSLSINIRKLEPKVRKKLEKIIKEEKGVILKKKTKETLIDFIKTEKSKEIKEILDLFKNKIPEDDFNILRASLYIRKRFISGASREEIYKLKKEIREKYGKRGLSICNLVSAGYFEVLIKPLYEEMSKDEDFSHEKFLEVYNIIVNESAFAVFISREMSIDNVEKEIYSKMRRNAKYGINFVSIHGIGKQNVEKIEKVIEKIQKEKPDISINKEVRDRIIYANIRY